MRDVKPPIGVELKWAGDLRFEGRSETVTFTLDSAGLRGPSPMQALAFALAGCMAVDVVYILTKGRHPLAALHATLTGRRASEEPRRFEHLALHFVVGGPIAAAHVERALALSREKYCSVWHSLRQDVPFDVTYEFDQGLGPGGCGLGVGD